MKVLKISIIATLLAGCGIDANRQYKVIRITSIREKCTYELMAIKGYVNIYEDIIDTSGKFKVGDTVYIKMTPTH